MRWFASVPWQYPCARSRSSERSVGEGAVGVMVIANVDGDSLTEPAFEPDLGGHRPLGLPVLVPSRGAARRRSMDLGRFDLSWSVGFNPPHYGEEPLADHEPYDHARDAITLKLIRWVITAAFRCFASAAASRN